jgi:hypothetical protein
MHDMIDRRVRAFLQRLARSQTGVQGGRLLLRSAKRGILSPICCCAKDCGGLESRGIGPPS